MPKITILYESDNSTMVLHVLLPEGNFGIGAFYLTEEDEQVGPHPFFSVTKTWLETQIGQAEAESVEIKQ